MWGQSLVDMPGELARTQSAQLIYKLPSMQPAREASHGLGVNYRKSVHALADFEMVHDHSVKSKA